MKIDKKLISGVIKLKLHRGDVKPKGSQWMFCDWRTKTLKFWVSACFTVSQNLSNRVWIDNQHGTMRKDNKVHIPLSKWQRGSSY